MYDQRLVSFAPSLMHKTTYYLCSATSRPIFERMLLVVLRHDVLGIAVSMRDCVRPRATHSNLPLRRLHWRFFRASQAE
jgi:hypothetical protein